MTAPAPHIMIDALNLSIGGGVVVMSRLAQALAAKGGRVTIMTARDLPNTDIDRAGITRLVKPEARGALRAQMFRRARLDQLAREVNADALVGFNYFSPVSLPQATYHINVIPFLPFRQRRAAVGLPRAILQSRAAQAALECSTLNAFESEHLRALARLDGAPHDADLVAYTGIDIPPAAGARPAPPERETICMVTSGASHKCNDTALRVFRVFAETRATTRLEIFGNEKAIRASLPNDLAAYCETSGQVVFRGYVGRAELYATLANAFALLTASRLESFYMVALEAMIVGCPVVAADISSVRESTGGAGRLFPVGDWRAASQALGDLRDRHVWATASKASYDWASRFDSATLSAAFADRLLTLADKRAA